jgi:hypothetical protein
VFFPILLLQGEAPCGILVCGKGGVGLGIEKARKAELNLPPEPSHTRNRVMAKKAKKKKMKK